MSMEHVFRNARIVLADEVVHGTFVVRGDTFVDVASGSTSLSKAAAKMVPTPASRATSTAAPQRW